MTHSFPTRRPSDLVVLALEERRNALPLKDLLRIKTAGVHVNDFSSFIERETGRVDLDTVNPSWLIFSDGRSEEHTSELQSLMRISYAVFCLKITPDKKQSTTYKHNETTQNN